MKSLIAFWGVFVFILLPVSDFDLVAQNNTENYTVETVVDKLPKLKKAGSNFAKHIQKKIQYPANAKLRGIEGDVWVAFIVTSSGIVKDVKVEKSLDAALDQVVMDFVKQTGPWKPGEKNGEVVNTRMVVPVKFMLNEDERNLSQQLKAFNMLDTPPLFVLDNKIIEGYVQIEDYNVESIRILKGNKALALYGKKGKNGVVVMTSKRGTPPIY